ncbi:PAS domain S-box protein [uncultured Zoogloea sp.]|uniref:PAS domain S-box protein n=1 Tax=uncultured Zoogloea sp. TaxID=160237 RepID=UPI00261053A1|nr:PAS domain S-box protein [uncultured Zoogloea sp.]
MPPPATPPLDPAHAGFTALFRFLPEMVALATLEDDRLIDVNDNWTAALGYARDESVGHSCSDLGIWHDPEDLHQIRAELLAGHTVVDRPVVLLTKARTPVETLLRARTLDIDGQTCILAVCQDITPRQRLEKARQEAAEAQRISEVMFSTAFHSSPEAITLSRLRDGKLLAVNPAFVTLTGWERDTALGTTAHALGLWPYPEERVAIVELLQEHAVLRDFQCTLGTADGSHRDCLVNASTVDIAGQTCLICIIRDVTDQKAAVANLHDSQNKFSTIFNSAPFALALTRISDRTYLDANPAWERLFGCPRDKIISRTSGELGCWLDPADYDDLYGGLATRDVVEQREVRLRPIGRPGIANCLVSARRLRVRDEDCALWSMVDISELRRVQAHIEDLNQSLELRVAERTAELTKALGILHQTQEELVRSEKMAALGSLVAGIAHELNTPIGNSVTVASTLAARTDDLIAAYSTGKLRRTDFDRFTQGTRQAVDLLMRSLLRAEELVRSFKQVAVDQTSEQRRRFELNEVLREMAITISPMFKHGDFTLDVLETAPFTLDSYPGPLGQIFTNLITNALLHAFEGLPRGSITVTPRVMDEDSVQIEFADDGRGIPIADQRRIFDPFFTTRLGRGGTGLGLHIVYNLVTQVLGGRITVHSSPGNGTRFVLALPRTAPARGEVQTAADAAANPGPGLNFDDLGPII